MGALGANPYQEILQFLAQQGVSFDEVSHSAVRTSAEAARMRGFSEKQGMKSLLVKAGDTFVLLIIPGNEKLDSKKVKTLLGVKKLRFATPEEVIRIMHCEIGACYPFGNLIPTPTYADKKLAENAIVACSPGMHTKSVKIRWIDYAKIVQPTLVDITEG